MQLKELRIGNYVLVDNNIAKVRCIDSIHDNKVQVELAGKELHEISIKEISPIPLNDETLMDCCNFNASQTDIVGADNHSYTLKLKDGHIILQDEKQNPMIHFWDITSLHQLQNLYYSLKKADMKVQFKKSRIITLG